MSSDLQTLPGLSDQEAADRRARGQGNDVKLASGRTYGQIFRENLLTFFNIVLFSLAAVLLLLGSPRDAFFTGAIAFLNIVVATMQEIRAKRKLDQISLLTRPKARIVRGGHARDLDPAEIVVGDILVAGAGDQVLVDGSVAQGTADVDESLLTGESDHVAKTDGSAVLSGSFVVSGQIAYTAQRVGEESFANKVTQGAREFTREMTPLQNEVNLVIRILLLVVILFGILIAINFFISQEVTLLQSVQAASVVFGLAPSSLFLMIVVAYALGAVRIADQGALVQQSNAVESLCHVDTLCLDKTGTLTANQIRLERVLPLTSLAEAEVRRLLGMYSSSVTAGNRTSEAIAEACVGPRLPLRDEVPFSSALKWSALAVDGADDPSEPVFPGVYVLGAPEMLAARLAPAEDGWSSTAAELAAEGQRVLMFAHAAPGSALYDADSAPQLPPGLTPLALVSFGDELRPEAFATLAGFREAGIQIKIISGDNPRTVEALARQAGLGQDGRALTVVSGVDLAQMDDGQFDRAAADAAIFGRIMPEQKQRLVRTLRQQGRYVAMTGDGVNDVLALKQAKLGIAMQSGTPATRAVADIVLLGDSFAALPQAFMEGQRIMNSMVDVLRLYLTRIFSLAVNIAVIAMLSAGFPYTPAQNSVISIFVLTIPAFALAVWARPGPQPRMSIIRQLVNFVLPATVVTSLTLSAVYLFFIITTGDWPYTQLAMTYATITTGLLLVIFVQPPTEFWSGGDRLAGDWRPTLLAAGLFVLLLTSPYVPILNGFFGLAQLNNVQDVLVIALATVLWLVLLRFTWKAHLIDRYLGLQLDHDR